MVCDNGEITIGVLWSVDCVLGTDGWRKKEFKETFLIFKELTRIKNIATLCLVYGCIPNAFSQIIPEWKEIYLKEEFDILVQSEDTIIQRINSTSGCNKLLVSCLLLLILPFWTLIIG